MSISDASIDDVRYLWHDVLSFTKAIPMLILRKKNSPVFKETIAK